MIVKTSRGLGLGRAALWLLVAVEVSGCGNVRVNSEFSALGTDSSGDGGSADVGLAGDSTGTLDGGVSDLDGTASSGDGSGSADGTSGGTSSGGASSGADGTTSSGGDTGTGDSIIGDGGASSGGTSSGGTSSGGDTGSGDDVGGGSSSGGDAGSSGGSDATGGCKSDAACDDGKPTPACMRKACVGGACTLLNEINGKACTWTDGKVAACHEPTCQTGKCVLTELANGTTCASQCTVKSGLNVWASSVCKTGTCTEQAAENCDDGAPCTKDSCNAAKGCQHATIAGFCDDYNACTDDTCDAVTGCQHVANKLACDDGDKCTADDKCSAGVCTGPTLVCACTGDVDCKTVNICRPASCGDAGKCVTKPSANTKCDDGSACTASDTCDGKGVCVGTKLICTDGVLCTTDTCDAVAGCQHLPDNPSCDDGNPCSSSQCLKTGCKYGDNDGADCDDGDKCSSSGVCKGGKCGNGAPKSCFDGNACTKDACEATTGKCVYGTLADGSACDDGDQCTLQDSCTSGKCAGKGDCNDGNSCTKDTCDPKAGCAHLVTNGVVCSDNDECTTGDTCSKDVCIAKATKQCEDGNPCTTDSCVTGKGCVAEPGNQGYECGGGTQALACNGGACKAFTAPKDAKWVKGGTFLMGCNAKSDGQCGSNEKPTLTVTLDGFYVDQFEVTAQQFKFCVLSAKCTDAQSGAKGANYNNNAKQTHPINFVTWAQAGAYCADKKGRLCTEAEWEKAARGASGGVFPWGNTAPGCALAVYSGCGAATEPADSFPKGSSPYGAQHMAGNVREWVADWYSSTWYAQTPGAKATDPKGPKSGTARVVRGGYYGSSATQIRASARGFVSPGATSASIGFRCCYDF